MTAPHQGRADTQSQIEGDVGVNVFAELHQQLDKCTNYVKKQVNRPSEINERRSLQQHCTSTLL